LRSLKLVFRTDDLHKVRNFAEDLSLHLGDLGTLPMEEADKATDTVVVTRIDRRHLGRCRTQIEATLKKHFLKEVCEIVEQG
jgi:hypothetical protein